MSDAQNAENFKLAKRAAGMMVAQLAPLPDAAQLEAATMVLKALYMTKIRAEKRLSLFNRCMQAVKAEIKADLQKKG